MNAAPDLNPKIVRVHRIFFVAYFGFAIVFALIGAAQLLNGHSHDWAIGFVGLGVLPLGLVHFAAARGARRGTTWGRVLSTVIGIILLVGFPLGTVAGVYLLYQLSKWKSGVQNETDASAVSAAD